MTYAQYWYEDSLMVEAFREADRLRNEKTDAEQWKQGMYIYEAIGCLAPLLHAFAKNPKPLPYPEKPYLMQHKEKTEEEREREEESERLKMEVFLNNWIKQTSEKFKNKGGDLSG